MTAVLRAEGLTRVFATPAGEVRAVDGATLEVAAGELVVLQGRSGAGKTTLLTMLGGLDRPTAGRVELDGRALETLDEHELREVRSTRVASVFQTFGLLPVLSAAENVEVPLRILRVPRAERERRVAEALAAVDLSDHAAQRPGELSGGQQQRVGIARAIVIRPALLLADEPTGQLDSETGAAIMDLIARLVADTGMAALVATHDPALAERANRVLRIHDGRLDG
ncbi:MAG TPA: ABC transporter ATP-binding protein [Protaetiibacter sp.]|nr:ABC transporter ATP-binding protein [Protaetiibacter sp.]